MTISLSEHAIDSLTTYLSANIAAKLADLTAEYAAADAAAGRTVTLPSPTFYDAEQSELPAQSSIFILAESNDLAPRGSGYITNRPSINLIVLAYDASASALRRKLYRYVRGLVELLVAGESTGYPYGLYALAADFNPIYGSPGEPFFADARLTFELFRQETF